jgi:hypothetical protein
VKEVCVRVEIGGSLCVESRREEIRDLVTGRAQERFV